MMLRNGRLVAWLVAAVVAVCYGNKKWRLRIWEECPSLDVTNMGRLARHGDGKRLGWWGAGLGGGTWFHFSRLETPLGQARVFVLYACFH